MTMTAESLTMLLLLKTDTYRLKCLIDTEYRMGSSVEEPAW